MCLRRHICLCVVCMLLTLQVLSPSMSDDLSVCQWLSSGAQSQYVWSSKCSTQEKLKTLHQCQLHCQGTKLHHWVGQQYLCSTFTAILTLLVSLQENSKKLKMKFPTKIPNRKTKCKSTKTSNSSNLNESLDILRLDPGLSLPDTKIQHQRAAAGKTHT